MGFIFGLIKRLIKLAVLFLIFAAVIVLVPNLPPYSKFTAIEIEPYQPRVGPLAPNGDLNNAEKLYKDKVLGPEAFQLYNGEVYTSLATGEIVKLSPGGHVTFVTKIGQPCTGLTQAHICGRPLGFQIDEKTNQLYVADAFYGIWKVDLKTDKKQLLVSPRVEIEGRKPKIFNDLALAKNGDLYWSDSSSEFSLTDGSYSTLTDPTGRLFYYNAAKNQSKVILGNVWLANGVAISPDQQFVVVAETVRMRLLKYYIDGPKKGKSEVFVTGLPGMPDNLRELPDGSGVVAALYTVTDEHHPLITKSLSQAPLARKFLARIQRLIEIPFEFLNTHFPNVVFEEVVHHIGHFQSVSPFMPGIGGIAVIDWNGNIVASYYNTDGTQKSISDVIVYNDKLYMGSPNEQNYIAAVPAPPLLKKAFASAKASPPPKTAETVTKEIPKPKVESKPAPAKPVETPKPQEKPKVEQKKEDIKVAKPVAQEAPKPTQPPKQPEPVKTTTPKPVEKKPVAEQKAAPAAKPQQPPKQADSKPVTPKPEAKPSKVEQEKSKPPKQNEPKTPPPKTEPKASPPPKAETKPKSEPAVKPQTKEEPKTKKTVGEKPQKQVNDKSGSKPLPEQIPIEEEIPSDTVKPNKETLKVIKKDGPTEIPNPNL